jgi:monofunctional biosynthetic peptidoglycan transglycosylase
MLFLLSLGYLVLCRWVYPPITITQLSSLVEGAGLKRDYVSGEKISPNLRLAVIASEDQLFPDHNGFDWGAVEKSLKGERQGRKGKRPVGAAASTLSQQTAKNVFLWQGGGWSRYVRKVLEAPYTGLIELIWAKRRILDVYLNVAEMGPGIYGAEAASRAYFHKPASQLSRKEAAMIAACLPSPSRFTVVPLSKRVAGRTPWILRQMANLEGDPEVHLLIQ